MNGDEKRRASSFEVGEVGHLCFLMAGMARERVLAHPHCRVWSKECSSSGQLRYRDTSCLCETLMRCLFFLNGLNRLFPRTAFNCP
jgi:hypothetical protein